MNYAKSSKEAEEVSKQVLSRLFTLYGEDFLELYGEISKYMASFLSSLFPPILQTVIVIYQIGWIYKLAFCQNFPVQYVCCLLFFFFF